MYIHEIIRTDGSRESIERKMELREMQELVGGYIETVPSKTRGEIIVVDEEGTFKSYLPNPKANALVRDDVLRVGGMIYGTALRGRLKAPAKRRTG